MGRSSSTIKLVMVLLTAFSMSAARGQTAKSVTQLDDNQIRGTWYQIARYPDKREKQCVGDAYELITRGDKLNQLLLVDSCKTKGSYADVRNITAKRQDKKIADGRLKITTIWPFTRKYWILATAPKFDWFLAGSPDHKSLWIYAKAPMLEPEVLAQVEAIATTDGYAANRLTMTLQSGSKAKANQIVAP